MLSLVAAMVVMASEPSAAGLAPRFVQVQAASPGEQPTAETYAGWSRGQLELEQQRLVDLRPSPGLPIALLASGAAIVLIDLVVVMFAGLIALTGSTGLPVPVTAGIATAAFVGAGMIIIGVILLVRILGERRELGAQIDGVKAAIERLSTGAPPPTNEPEPVPEPRPSEPPASTPYPLQVQWAPSIVTVTLARF